MIVSLGLYNTLCIKYVLNWTNIYDFTWARTFFLYYWDLIQVLYIDSKIICKSFEDYELCQKYSEVEITNENRLKKKLYIEAFTEFFNLIIFMAL